MVRGSSSAAGESVPAAGEHFWAIPIAALPTSLSLIRAPCLGIGFPRALPRFVHLIALERLSVPLAFQRPSRDPVVGRGANDPLGSVRARSALRESPIARSANSGGTC